MDTLTKVSIYVGFIAISIYIVGVNLINKRREAVTRSILLILAIIITYIVAKVLIERYVLTIKDNTHKLVLKSVVGGISKHKFDNMCIYEYNDVPFMFVSDRDTNIIDEHKTISMDNGLLLGYVSDYSLICNKRYKADYNKVISSIEQCFGEK